MHRVEVERDSGVIEERCGKPKMRWKRELTKVAGLIGWIGSMDATLLDREANCSLTTDTMCQNLFDPIRASSTDG
jgi:hypothetical protein